MRHPLSDLVDYTRSMPAAQHTRIQRLRRLESLLPKPD
jgi:hypothetical protein